MSSHPGSRLSDAVNLAEYLKKIGCSPEQVQDYYPTPGTSSTVMFYTGIDPLTMKEVYCEGDYHGKIMQRALLQFNKPENAAIVREALTKCGREDLIGNTPNCLVRPDRQHKGAIEGSRGAQGGKKAPSGGKKPSSKTSYGAKNKKAYAPKNKPKKGR